MPPVPIRSIRVPDDLWLAARRKAGMDGISSVIIRFLEEYVHADDNRSEAK